MAVHGKNTKVLINSTNFTTSFKEYSVAQKMDVAEASTFGVNTKQYVQGLKDATLSLSGYFDGSADAIDSVLNAAIGATTDPVFTVAPAGSFALGQRVISGQAIESSYNISGSIGDIVAVSAEFQTDGGLGTGTSLHNLVAASIGAFTDTGQLNPTNAASTAGGYAVLHVTANTTNSGSTTVKVQHSVDDVTYVDLVTFTAFAFAAKTQEFKSVAEGVTINKYLRATGTVGGSSGTATFTVSFVRF